MSKITEAQLISQLKELKEIKPRKEWAILLKSQILSENQTETVKIPAQKVGNWEIGKLIENWKLIIGNSFSRKLAYSFAAFLFIIVGLAGFSKYSMPGDLLFPAKKISEQSTAALSGQTTLKQDVTALSNRINDLAQVAREGKRGNIPSAISEINANVLALTKNLKNNPVSDPKTLKDIASSLKILADVPGTDLTTNPDVESLYQTVVKSQIADLQKTTLTDLQKASLAAAEDLYSQGKYADALESLLNLTSNVSDNPANDSGLINTTSPTNQ
jgi:hypothetical protein